MKVNPTPTSWIYSQGSVYEAEPLDADGYPTSALAHMDRENPRTYGAERDANGWLMSLAPEMLAVLKYDSDYEERYQRITARMGNGATLRDALYAEAEPLRTVIAKAER